MEKRCITCDEVKDISEFYTHPQMADGYLTKCKSCCKKQAKERRLAKLEEIREYDRNRPNKAERTRKCKEYKDKLRVENPEKFDGIFHTSRKNYRAKYHNKSLAVGMINDMLRSGKIKRPDTCSVCGKKCKPQAHHPDYSKPKEIVWVCVGCHSDIHKKLREEQRKKKVVSLKKVA